MAGLEHLVDTPQKRIRATVLTGLTGVLAMEAFSVAAQDEDDEEEPTATATATGNGNSGTATPEGRTTEVAQVATPTPGETLVALAPVDAIAASMASYPSEVSYVSRRETPVNFEVNWSNVEPLMGTTGPIQPGLYEDRPAGFSLDVMNNPELTINGEEVDLDYMVGVVSLIEPGSWNDAALPIIYITVPMRQLNENGMAVEESSEARYGTFQAYLLNSGNHFAVLESNGNAAALPEGYDGDNFSSSNFGNTENLFQYNPDGGGVITIQTAQGPVELRPGRAIAIEYVGNMEEVLPDVAAENGRTPDQVIEDYMNGEGNLTGRSGPRSMIWPIDIVFQRPR